MCGPIFFETLHKMSYENQKQALKELLMNKKGVFRLYWVWHLVLFPSIIFVMEDKR